MTTPSPYETITQAVRTWVRTVLEWTEEEAADLVVPVDRGSEKGRRPAIPFLTVDLALSGQQVGTDETKYASDLSKLRKGTRRGRVNIQGYGEGTDGWLESLAMNVGMATTPLTVNGYGEIIDIAQLAGSHLEYRFSRDFDVGYAIVETREDAFSELEQVISEIADTGLEPDLEVTLDVTLP